MTVDAIVQAVGVEPYFRDEAVAIYHADCRDILPLIPPGSVDLVLTDPPYGINHPTDYASRGRGNLAACNDYPPVYGDNEHFDPRTVFLLGVPAILWGANYYPAHLPASCWLLWDKRVMEIVNDQADGEMAWTNAVKGSVRIFRHMWNGFLRDSERGENYHPTQKPVALMRWCLSLVPDAQTILDPFMGSGPTLRAAKDLGRYAIGIEIEEKYCAIAAQRMSQMVMPLEAK